MKTRNPKSEIRNPKREDRPFWIFGIGSFGFFRISDFGFRISILGLCVLAGGCQQEMARQPYYRPLEPTDFFPDGRSSRPLVDGTVPRGRPLDQSSILTYRRGSAHGDAARAVALIGNPTMNAFAALLPFTAGAGVADYVDVFPIDMDKKAMERGRERFNIYCAVCHDALGTGNGKIVERGYLRPPNYHTDKSRGFERRGISAAAARSPGRLLFRGHHARLRRYARLRQPDTARRSLENHRLHPGLAAQSMGSAQGFARERAAKGSPRSANRGGATVSSAITPATSLASSPVRAELTGAEWERYRRTALLAAGGGLAVFALVGLLLWLMDGIHAPKQLFLSYLVGYNYWLGKRARLPGVPDVAIRHRRRVGVAAAAHSGGGGRHVASIGHPVYPYITRPTLRLQVRGMESRTDQRTIALQGRLAQRLPSWPRPSPISPAGLA